MIRSQKKQKSFVVCLANDGYAASLEARKIYVAVRDAAAERNGLLRVVDESGEEYLHERDRFAALKLPARVQKALAAANEHGSRAAGGSGPRGSRAVGVGNTRRSPKRRGHRASA